MARGVRRRAGSAARRAGKRLLASALVLGALVSGALGAACRSKEASPEAVPSASASSRVGPPLGPPTEKPTPRVGMAWISAGALVAGTPVNRLPRVADEEMAGEQIILDGFYIDRYPFPNEEGAIPVTGISQSEARSLCEERGKRLCSELEWERACKGPDNRTYEYGETYRASVCDTGKLAKLRPSGLSPACQTDFGVHDMHGSAFEWTDSPWGRGGTNGEVTLRGGNDRRGELVGRCANARPASAETRSGTIGFRCCAGPRNQAEVSLHVAFPAGLLPRNRFDAAVEQSMLVALPDEAKSDLGSRHAPHAQRSWLWRPVANEELHALAVCTGSSQSGPSFEGCGLLIARINLGKVSVLGWVSSAEWPPTLHSGDGGVRDLWLVGGDRVGSFKRLVSYRSGEVEVGEIMRGKVDDLTKKPVPPKKKKR